MPAIPSNPIPGEKSYRLIKPITKPSPVKPGKPPVEPIKPPVKPGKPPVKPIGPKPKPEKPGNPSGDYLLMAERMNDPNGFYYN
jgi:hypothetical protein